MLEETTEILNVLLKKEKKPFSDSHWLIALQFLFYYKNEKKSDGTKI